MRTEPLIIYHNTKPLCQAEKWTFYDKVQSVGGQYISTTIKSPVPITFSVGDYCEYRGERYYMNNLPSVTQQAKPKEYGEGFVYDNVRFDGAGFELCRILMLDITPTTGLYIPKKGTNYTGSSNFQLYCAETRLTVDGTERIYPAVCTLAGKIQANLDRAYPTSGWKILVDTTTTHEVKGNTELRTHTDDKILSFNNTTVANALAEVNNTFKLNFHIKGRTIYIGYTLGAVTGNFMGNSGVVGDNDYYYLGYGRGYADKEHPGRGLYEIKKSSDANQQIITRLRAMGSTKNMPFRYYNKRYNLSQDLYPSNLQLPDTFKSPQEKQAGHRRRKTINKSVYEVLGETNDAYLDKYNDIKRCKEGLREGVAIWDGSNGLPEIYPTIERMTYGELRGNNCADMLGKTESGGGAQVNGHSSFYYYDNNERVDEILAVGKLTGTILSDDANLGKGLLQPDKLEESSNIDCPCNVKSSFFISYLQNKVDRGYDLFPPIRMQAAGKYILSPEAPSLRAEVSINTGRHEADGNHASGLCYYEIILSSVSLKDNQKTTIGKYVSEKKAVSSDQPCLIELPKLPDLFDDKKEEETKYDAQIKAIQLDSVSDVYASIVFHVEDIKRDVQDNVYLTVYAGKPSFGKEASVMKDKLGVYVWSPSIEDKKDVNKPFHVIIKDIGISQFVSQFSGGEQPMLSMKDGNCLGRNFLIGKDVKRVTYTKNGNTYNGWQLELTRTTDDSIHRYYPNQTDRLQAGDHYVLLGIPMPDVYVQAAEMRLLVAASQYLRDNSRTKYNYEPKVDELFLARNYDRCESKGAKEQSIYWNLYAGLRLPFFGSPNTDNADEELPLVNIPIESLTIKEGDGIIPKVELHLREGNSQSTIQQINAKVDALYDGMNRGNGGMTLSDTNTAIFRTGVKYFLRKDIADTAEQVMTFLKGIVAKAVSYFHGIDNRGDIKNNGDITNTGNISNAGDITNSGTITTKNLNVTNKATFFELEIQKAKAAGGIIIQSAATFKVDDCEDTAAGYVCYQMAEKDGKVLRQMCHVGDQMLCYGGLNVDVGVSHNVSNHYYWRMVTDAPEEPVERGGKKYLKIVLSKTEFADGSDKPQVGDELAQVGSRVDADRQCVIISSAYHSLDLGLVAPYWAKYVGVDDFELETHRETYFARNDNQIVGNLKAKSSSGEIRPVPALLGEWKSGKEYGYYDSVTHDGRQWLCIVEPGKRTTEEPGKGDAWMLLVDKGEKGKDGHSLTAKAFMEGTYRNGFTKDVKSYVKVYYDGQEVKDFNASYRYKGDFQKDWSEPLVTNSGVWGDAQRDGSTLFVEYAVEYKGLKAVATGRLDNIQDGKDGIAGKDGKDGRTTYFHVKYANVASPTSSSQMNETGGDYMGTYVDFTQADSDDPKRYTWIKTKGAQGADGTQGIAGKNGADGRTSYLHIKYSNDGGNTFTSNSGEDTGDYIGQYVDFIVADSNNPRDYKWALVKGKDGKDGHSLVAKVFMEGSYRNGFTKDVKSYVKVYYDGQEVTDFKVSYRYKGDWQKDWSEPLVTNSGVWGDAQRDGSTLYVEYAVEYKGLKAVVTGRLDNIQDGKDAVVWQVAFSIRHITDKQGETFRLKVVRIVGDKAEEVDHAAIIAAGADLLVFGDDMGAELRVNPGEDYLTAEYPHSRYLMARVVRYGTDITLAQDTIYPEAKPGKDAVEFRLVQRGGYAIVKGESKESAIVEINVTYQVFRCTNGKEESINIEDYGLKLKTSISDLTFLTQIEDDDFTYKINKNVSYKDVSNQQFGDNLSIVLTRVNYSKGVIDSSVIPFQYDINVAFDFGKKVDGLDSKIDGVAGKVSTLDGRVSGFEATIDHFRTEVKDKVSHSELKQTADGIVMKVGSSVNANLLWGSDLDLDGVDITNKAAIQKHLGVVISGDMEVGNREMFQYLKGEGVGGADAIRFKNMYKRENWAQLTNISWRDVPLKPNTRYTISVWVKFKSYGGKGRMYVDSTSDDGRYCFGGYLYKEHFYDRADIDEWQRVRYVFNSGASKKMSSLLFACIADEEEGAQCEMWLCRPKLEEGDTATPWCAYDGMVEELLNGGIDIKNRKIIATTDNFKVQNNKGEQTFLVDKNGRINAKLIDATEIYGLKIAQPFETYASKEELKNGKSLSWVMETWEKDYGFILGQKGMNGVTLNIFNCTGSSISFTIPLITPSKICQVEVPNNVMLRAVAIYRKVWNGCQWYLICPWEDIGNNRIHIKAFG